MTEKVAPRGSLERALLDAGHDPDEVRAFVAEAHARADVSAQKGALPLKARHYLQRAEQLEREAEAALQAATALREQARELTQAEGA